MLLLLLHCVLHRQVITEAVFWHGGTVLPSVATSPWPVQVSAAIPLTLSVVRNVTGPGTLGDAHIAVAALDRSTTGDVTFTMSGAKRG
jgi:hypothetical protein